MPRRKPAPRRPRQTASRQPTPRPTPKASPQPASARSLLPAPTAAPAAASTNDAKPRSRKGRGARTATGKPMRPGMLAEASEHALVGLRERTEEGHLRAGRTPPSLVVRSGEETREIDDSIRNPLFVVTEDEKLLQQIGPHDDFTRTDPWRVMRIMGEFIEGFDKLASVDKGVTIFGSARIGPDGPQ